MYGGVQPLLQPTFKKKLIWQLVFSRLPNDNNFAKHHHQGCVELSDAFVVAVWRHRYVVWHTYVSLWRNLEGSSLWRQIFNILTASLNSYSFRVYSKSLFPLMSHHLWSQVTVATTLTGVRHLYLLYFALYINWYMVDMQSTIPKLSMFTINTVLAKTKLLIDQYYCTWKDQGAGHAFDWFVHHSVFLGTSSSVSIYLLINIIVLE